MTKYILIISHVLAFGLGFYISQPEIVERVTVREVEKPVYKYIQKVAKDDCAELFKAYSSPIMLDNTVNGGIMNVRASDGYKETTATWQIMTTPDYKVYIGIGAAGFLLGGYAAYKLTR